MAQTQPETSRPAAGQTGKSASGGDKPDDEKPDAKNGGGGSTDVDPTEMLSADHRQVERLFSSFEKATNAEQKWQLATQICTELTVHALIEEEIFYPACRGQVEERLLDEAQVEHDGAKTLIIDIRAGAPDEPYFDAKIKVLSEDIKHHVREEEKAGGIFARAKENGVATADLAKRLAARKEELMEQAKAGALGPPRTRSFRAQLTTGTDQLSQEDQMSRSSSSTMERERDERGRFVSDDDRDERRRPYGRGRDDEDDRRRSMPPRDEDGRFVGTRSRYDDDDDRRYSRSRSRDYDDDDRRRGPGHGGWYGDPEGHSEASRRGWDNTDHGRSGWYGDPDRHSEASRRGWEEGGGSRSRYREDDRRGSMPARDDEGRFTSSRSRYDDNGDDRRGGRGHGGWYGDPQGHSEASRRGWDERGGSQTRYRDDDDDRHFRSRYEDDDDRRGGRGHGGWYGDPEGHSEAARRRR